MIKIEITDPHLVDKHAMYKTAKYLMGMVGLPMTTDMALLGPNTTSNQGFWTEPKNECNQSGRIPASEPTRAEVTTPVNNFEKPFAGLPIATVGQGINPQTAQWEDPKPLQGNDNAGAGNPFAPVDTEKFPNTDRPLQEFNVLDVAGLPWDARIHSRTKSKTSDGKWRYQRGVHDHVITQVEAELKLNTGTPAYKLPPTPAPAAVAPPPPYVPPAPVAPLIDLMAPKADFPTFMSKVTSLNQTGKIDRERVVLIIQQFGIPNIPSVATRPDLIPAIMKAIDDVVGA